MPWGSCSPMCGGPFDRSNWKSWVEQANDRGIPGISTAVLHKLAREKDLNFASMRRFGTRTEAMVRSLTNFQSSKLTQEEAIDISAVSNKSPVCVGSYPHSSSTEAAPVGKADLWAEALEVGCHGDVRRAPGTLDRPGPCYRPGSIARARWIQVARWPQNPQIIWRKTWRVYTMWWWAPITYLKRMAQKLVSYHFNIHFNSAYINTVTSGRCTPQHWDSTKCSSFFRHNSWSSFSATRHHHFCSRLQVLTSCLLGLCRAGDSYKIGIEAVPYYTKNLVICSPLYMLHHVAPCCTMLHHVAPCCTMLHHVAPCCTMLHHVAPPTSSPKSTCQAATNSR